MNKNKSIKKYPGTAEQSGTEVGTNFKQRLQSKVTITNGNYGEKLVDVTFTN